MSQGDPWFVYLLECGDGTFYTGVAKDVVQRVQAHNDGVGAKYTRGRGPVRLITSSDPLSKSEAFRLERQVKKKPRAAKRGLIETAQPSAEM